MPIRDQLDLEELDRQVTHTAKMWQKINKITLYTLIFVIAVSFLYPSSALVFGSPWNSSLDNIVSNLPFVTLFVSASFTLILGMREETARWRYGYKALKPITANIQPPSVWGFMVLHYRRFISTTLILIVIVIALVDNRTDVLIIYLLFYFALGHVHKALYVWPYHGVFQRGDYEGGLRRANILWGVLIGKGGYLTTRTSLLLMLGRFAEAEQMARKALTPTKNNPSELSSALSMLGRALQEQNRYAEVLPCYEGAIKLSPGYAPYYTRLANFYLKQESELERAFALVQRALAYSDKPKPNRFLEMFQWVALKGTEARLLALLGYHQQANAALEAGFDALAVEFGPGLADLHLEAGYVSERQRDLAAAQSHYEQAQRLDPNGAMGQQAHLALLTLKQTIEQSTSSPK